MKMKLLERNLKEDLSPALLRRQNLIPGVIYGNGLNSTPFKVNTVNLEQASASGEHVMDIDLGGKKMIANIVELQRHPVNQKPIHVSLFKLKKGQATTITAPIKLMGEAKGEKEGGVVSQLLDEIEIEGKPKDLPDFLEINMDDLDIGDNLNLQEVKVPEGIKIIEEDMEKTVVVCRPPAKEEDVEADTTETETEETATNSEGEGEETSADSEGSSENKE